MPFEIEIIKWLQNLRSNVLDHLFEYITMFGEEMVIILVLGFVYWSLNKEKGKRLAVIVFISMGINSLLKIVFGRLRPFQVDSEIINLRPETSQSYAMPSGHTQGASTVFFGLAYFFKKKYLWIIAVIITILVGISRMYIGVHYLSDVIVGGLLGLLMVISIDYLLNRIKNQKSIYLTLIVISIVALIVMMIINGIQATSPSEIYQELEVMSKMFGTLLGFGLGVLFEEKYVNFHNHRNMTKNAIRFVVGIGFILIIRIGLKAIFGFIVDPDDLGGTLLPAFIALFFDYIRYGVMVFVGLGVYPILIKKLSI